MSEKNTFIARLVIHVYKYGNKIYYSKKNKFIKKILMITYKILDFIFVKVIAGSDIPAQCQIGKNLYLAHGGRGVVIHPRAKIGNNVDICHQVTIGSGKVGNNGAPVIGDNVFIGVGAKVLGTFKVGDNVKVGANAVVTKEVQNNKTVIEFNKILN